MNIRTFIRTLLKSEKGQGMTEYGFVLTAIAVAAFGALVLLGDELTEMFTRVASVVDQRYSIGN